MIKIILKILPVIDILLIPFIYPAAWLMKMVRRAGVHRLPFCKSAFLKIGVFPIRDHYYEPQFDFRTKKQYLSQDRDLPGINWNIEEQIKFLDNFSYANELEGMPQEKPASLQFYFNNITFESGDAEYWYQLIRFFKPATIIEVGSGNSTLMAIRAIRKNKEENSNYLCKHVCIEPFQNPWLAETGVTVLRKKVEDFEPGFFSGLNKNDILFIDSSHIIRPQGDVLFEYLELLPSLNKGVIVHIHDIFSPKNYLRRWLEDEVRFWNEQYLLEAFLSHNKDWRIIGALNYLHHNHYDRLKSVAPYLTPAREPGSFYIQKIT